MQNKKSDDCKVFLAKNFPETSPNNWKRLSKKGNEASGFVREFVHGKVGIVVVLEKDGVLSIEKKEVPSLDIPAGTIVYVLSDYILFKGTVMSCKDGSAKVDIPAQHWWGASVKNVTADRLAREDEPIMVLRERENGKTDRFTYRIERERFQDRLIPAKEWAYKSFFEVLPDGGLVSGIVGEDSLRPLIAPAPSESGPDEAPEPAVMDIREPEPDGCQATGEHGFLTALYDCVITKHGMRPMNNGEDPTEVNWKELIGRFLTLRARKLEHIKSELRVEFDYKDILPSGLRKFSFNDHHAFVVTAGTERETPVAYFFYLGNDNDVHIHVPMGGNPYNTDTNKAYGHDTGSDSMNLSVRLAQAGIPLSSISGNIRKDAGKLRSEERQDEDFIAAKIVAGCTAGKEHDNPFDDDFFGRTNSQFNPDIPTIPDHPVPDALLEQAGMLMKAFLEDRDANWDKMERMSNGSPDERRALASQILFSPGKGLLNEDDGIPTVAVTPVLYWKSEQAQYDQEMPIAGLFGGNAEEVTECVWVPWGSETSDLGGITSSLIFKGFVFDEGFHRFMTQGADDECSSSAERAVRIQRNHRRGR